MDIFIRIAEKRIEEAMREGEFENLQNAGKPFVFEDETWIPEDLRIAYKVLKNAGCTPPELEASKEIIGLKELINTLDDDKERMKKIRELNFKIMRFNMMRKRPLCLEAFPDYEMRFFEKTID